MPCGQPKFSSSPSAPASSVRFTISCQAVARRFHHQRRDHGVLRVTLLDFGDLAQVGVDGAVADELDIVQPHHALAVPIDRGIARRDVENGVADGFPDGAAPALVERAHDLLAAVGGRAGRQPERVGTANAGEISGEIGHVQMLRKEKIISATDGHGCTRIRPSLFLSVCIRVHPWPIMSCREGIICPLRLPLRRVSLRTAASLGDSRTEVAGDTERRRKSAYFVVCEFQRFSALLHCKCAQSSRAATIVANRSSWNVKTRKPPWPPPPPWALVLPCRLFSPCLRGSVVNTCFDCGSAALCLCGELHAAPIATAARFPSATASTTSRPPLTQSPPA
jgi:hypothetical protein